MSSRLVRQHTMSARLLHTLPIASSLVLDPRVFTHFETNTIWVTTFSFTTNGVRKRMFGCTERSTEDPSRQRFFCFVGKSWVKRWAFSIQNHEIRSATS